MVIDFCDSRVVLGAVFGTQNTGDASEKFGYSTEEDEFWRAGTSGLHPACVEEDGLLSQFFGATWLYTGMRFRNFISKKAEAPLREADLLGVPSSGASTPAPSQSSPSGSPTSGSNDRPDGDSTAGGAARSPHQLQRAVTLATELQKLLGSLPHPLNKQFHAFQQPLQAFLDRLQQITQA